jgi:peptidoglycan hydrolase-like protein with peptidoglycan-binding domain
MPATVSQRLFHIPSRDDLDCLPDPAEGVVGGGLPGEGLFDLQAGVGAGQANRRDDVCRLQALLHLEGYLDTAGTGGPTGHWAARDDFALRKFQKDNGLAIDGIAQPDGETIETLRSFSQ